MKSKRSLIILSFVIVSLLIISVVFAYEDTQNEKISFGSWLNKLLGKISGKTITGMQTSVCSDPDGKDIHFKGYCTDVVSYIDSCSSTISVKEYFCSNKGCTNEFISCPIGENCQEGACVPGSGGMESEGGGSLLFCSDVDNDGYFPLSKGCTGPYDCNDNNPLIRPGAFETCGNNIDEDCSGADLACGITPIIPPCIPNWTKTLTPCRADETFTAYYLNQSSCILGAGAFPQNETFNCDYNKNNLVCESFPGIENVGIGGYLLNASRNYTNSGSQLVQLAQSGGAGVDFKWDFSNSLDFCNISVEVADSTSDNFGYTIVKNVAVTNKTVWIERLNNSNQVCVKDIPGEILIGDFSKNCSDNDEELVSCPSGINSTYSCEIVYDQANINFSWFQVWPLNHSAVKEMPPSTTTSRVCSENWNCTEFSDAISQCGTRICSDLNNCGTTFTKPIENVSCIPVQEAAECIPDWSCADFGKCTKGLQERTCTDLNSCGDDEAKPTEIQECKNKINFLIIAIIIFGLLLIIFLIWYFMMKKKSTKKFSGEHKAPVHTAPPSPPKHPSVSHPQSNVYTPRPQYPHAHAR